MTDGTTGIRVGVPESHRRAAAELYWEAFGRKLAPALGPRERGVTLLARHLNLGCAVAMVDGDELLGLAGFHRGGSQLAGMPLLAVVREFGPLRGAWRALLLVLLHRSPREDELLMDGIVVRADSRGRGIGTALLRGVVEVARATGARTIRLDVVDTNPGARRLYERLGFVATRTEHVPYLRRLMGFGAATEMVLRVNAADLAYPSRAERAQGGHE